MFSNRVPIDIESTLPPMLAVVIDTEEEFDWHGPFDRNATTVRHMRDIGKVQAVFDRFGVRPTYVVDYPVATQPAAYEPLKDYAQTGRAVIGAHLHPWVSPPHEEEVCLYNSYPGNLPAGLERRKLVLLTGQIEETFGRAPTIYKAGRYGFGPHTGGILEDLGFEIDVSPMPSRDLSHEGGPDYLGETVDPFWFGRRRRLLCLPGTGALVGVLGVWASRFGVPAALGRALYRWADRPPLRRMHAPGILARCGAVERLVLSPEGYTQSELRRLTRALLAAGKRLFVLAFHSPSVQPGHTPFVRSANDLQRLLDDLCRYFEFFLDELGGLAVTPPEVRRRLLDGEPWAIRGAEPLGQPAGSPNLASDRS